MRKFKKVLAFALAAAMVVTAAPVSTQAAAMKLNKTTATIYINGSKTYKTVNLDVKNASTKTYSVAFTSSNTKIATVNKTSGVVTPKKNGKVTISAKVTNKKTKNYKTLKCTVTVKTAPTAVKVANKDLPETLNIGGTYDFGSSITPKDATNKRRWSITEGKGTITSVAGLFTATEAGKVTVQVKDTYSGKTATHTFTVVADAPTATQTGAKVITVKNGVSMKDRTITVKKGSTTTNLASTDGVVLSTDGLTATITTASKMTDGTYTVSVADKNIDVTASTEKVAKIAFLSTDKAAIDGTSPNKASVGYKVENQFGEDITKTASVSISGSHNAVQASAGKIEFTKDSGSFNQNVDIVSAVIVDTTTGVSAQANLTISAKAAVASITSKGVYNLDGKTLSADSDLNKDVYYLLIDAKDQYGANVTKDQVLGRDIYVTVAGGMTNLSTKAGTDVKTVEVKKDGVAYMGVELGSTASDSKTIKSGSATVLIIASSNGTQANDTITVADGTQPVSLKATPKGTVTAGNGIKSEFTYEALDAYGKEVTSYDSLKDLTFSSPSGLGTMAFEKDYTTGKAKLVFTCSSNTITADTPVVITTQLSNNKVEMVNFTIRKAAVPTTITGIKDVDTSILAGVDPVDLKVENLVVEDQYGNIMETDSLVTTINGGNYKLHVKTADDVTTAVAVTSGATTVTTGGVLLASNVTKGSVIFSAGPVAAGSRTITVSFYDTSKTPNALVSSSPYDIDFKVNNQENLSSYSAKTVDKLAVVSKSNAGYEQTVEIIAKRAGSDVKIPNTQFSIVGSKHITAGSATDKVIFKDNGENLDDIFKVDGKAVTEITENLTVTIKNTGDQIKVPVTISREDPKIVSAKTISGFNGVRVPSGTALDNVLILDSSKDTSTGLTQAFADKFEVKDQYGKKVVAATAGSICFASATGEEVKPIITFKDIPSGVIPTSNGAYNASMLLPSGQKVTVQLDFGNGVVLEFKAEGFAN